MPSLHLSEIGEKERRKDLTIEEKEELILRMTRDWDLGTRLLERLTGPRPKPTRVQRVKWKLLEWAERILE